MTNMALVGKRSRQATTACRSDLDAGIIKTACVPERVRPIPAARLRRLRRILAEQEERERAAFRKG